MGAKHPSLNRNRAIKNLFGEEITENFPSSTDDWFQHLLDTTDFPYRKTFFDTFSETDKATFFAIFKGRVQQFEKEQFERWFFEAQSDEDDILDETKAALEAFVLEHV